MVSVRVVQARARPRARVRARATRARVRARVATHDPRTELLPTVLGQDLARVAAHDGEVRVVRVRVVKA